MKPRLLTTLLILALGWTGCDGPVFRRSRNPDEKSVRAAVTAELPVQFRLVNLSFQPEGNRAARQQVSFTVAATTTLPLYEIKPADEPGERPFLLRPVTGVGQVVSLSGTMTAVGSPSAWSYTALRWETDLAGLGRLAAEFPRGLLVEGTPAAKAEIAARQKAKEEAAERERQRKEELARLEAERQAERERLARAEQERREAAQALRKQQEAELAERRRQEDLARQQADAERQLQEQQRQAVAEAGRQLAEARRARDLRDQDMIAHSMRMDQRLLVVARLELLREPPGKSAPPLEAQVFLDSRYNRMDKVVLMNRGAVPVRLKEMHVRSAKAESEPEISRRRTLLDPGECTVVFPGDVALRHTIEIHCVDFADPVRFVAVPRQ